MLGLFMAAIVCSTPSYPKPCPPEATREGEETPAMAILLPTGSEQKKARGVGLRLRVK